MKDYLVEIKTIKKQAEEIFLLSFESACFAKKTKAGQFLEVLVDSPELNLRRPFGIHHVKGNEVFILFRIRGKGTKILSEMKKGQKLKVLGPLGNGFKIESAMKSSKNHLIIIAGGMGVAPMVSLAQKCIEFKGRKTVFIGSRSKKDFLCEKDFKAYGFDVIASTDDGSKGYKGNAVSCFKNFCKSHEQELKNMRVFACGPEVMLHSLADYSKEVPSIKVQGSFEQFMGCGIGTCRACVIETTEGYKRVCKDGPVFDLEKIVF